MQVFLARLVVIIILFFLGALLGSLTGEGYLAIALWFSAVAAWTLILGFRKALWVVLPFLILADVLWDGRIGPLFFAGFLVATASTYLALRVETQSRILQVGIYSVVVSFFATAVIIAPMFFTEAWPSIAVVALTGKVFFVELIVTILTYSFIFRCIKRVEYFLDNSYQEQVKKIR